MFFNKFSTQYKFASINTFYVLYFLLPILWGVKQQVTLIPCTYSYGCNQVVYPIWFDVFMESKSGIFFRAVCLNDILHDSNVSFTLFKNRSEASSHIFVLSILFWEISHSMIVSWDCSSITVFVGILIANKPNFSLVFLSEFRLLAIFQLPYITSLSDKCFTSKINGFMIESHLSSSIKHSLL